jgi:hypothetical protein
MNKNKIKKVLQFSTLLVAMGALLFAGVAKAGFGISPPDFGEQNLVRGMTYEKSIIISRDDVSSELRANASIEVPGANEWISLDKGKAFTLKRGEGVTPIVIKVNIPENAEFKDYKGRIIIRTSPSELQAGTVGIALGGQISVDFSVVDRKINSFIIKDVNVSEIQQGGTTEVILTLANMGNVETAPTKITMDIYDQDKAELIVSKENISNLEKIKPFSSGHIKALFDTSGLPVGSYWGKVRVYNGSEIVYDDFVHMSITEATGKSAEKEKTGGFLASLQNDKTIMYAVILLLAIILLLLIKSLKKRKKEKRAGR